MNVYFDIETIPAQDGIHCLENYLVAEMESFKAPNTLTKTQACADLGLTGDKAKYTSKDDAIALWEKEFSKEKAPEVAEEKWRKTALDGAAGELISISWAIGDGAINNIHRDIGESEVALLKGFFCDLNNQLKGKPPYFIGQYIGGFDLKFLFHRSVILGIKPPFDLPFNGYHGRDYYCTQTAWAGKGGRMSQDNICKALGIKGKPDDIDGSKVWDFVKVGSVHRVAEYNDDDVEKVRQIHKRLTFSK